LTKIDFSKYHSALCVIYQSNVKQDIWATEWAWIEILNL